MPQPSSPHPNDTLLFNPAELDWFRHSPKATAAKPAVEVIFEAERPSSKLWWRELLTELD